MSSKTIEVLKKDFDTLVESVETLSAIGRMIKSSRLNERALLLLLKDQTGLSFQQIQKVLNALPELEKAFLKEKK